MELQAIITLAKAALQLVETNPELAKGLFTEMGKMLGADGAAAAEQISSLTKELGAAKETISNLTKQLGDIPILSDKLKTAENKISKLNKQITSLTEQIDEYKNTDIDKLKEENKRLKKEVETLNEKVEKYRPTKKLTGAEKNQILRELYDRGISFDSYDYNDVIEEHLDEFSEDELKVIKEYAEVKEKEKKDFKKKYLETPEQVFVLNKGGGNNFV